jgi:hypothetical protein
VLSGGLGEEVGHGESMLPRVFPGRCR